MQVSRRDLLRHATRGSVAVGVAAVGLGALAGRAHADPARPVLGTVVDFAGGVPSAAAIVAAGHIGAVRYVSDRRPGAQWMTGKPLTAAEAEALTAAGAQVVSCYQFGKGPTADWRGGTEAGKRHAERALELHTAAGGPTGRPIYASIDDNPTEAEYDSMIAPYLEGWQSVIGDVDLGVYANTPTIDRVIADRLGNFLWQHNWGTPRGYVHPNADLNQIRIDDDAIDGVGVDINTVLSADFGQWSLA